MLDNITKNTYNINNIDTETKKQIHNLRYNVFHKRLKWDVPVINNQEIDEYDELNPIFITAKDPSGELIGCLRILKTTNKYMLKDTFPQLLNNQAAPESKSILEISRFATQKSAYLFDPNEKRYVTYSVLQQAYLHAIEQGVEEYVMVTTCAIERYLRILGVPTSRLGNGLSMDIGGVNSVAIRMSMNNEFKNAVFSIH
jgi:acyl homoserine lactone synthase